jgi:hypothetical protein
MIVAPGDGADPCVAAMPAKALAAIATPILSFSSDTIRPITMTIAILPMLSVPLNELLPRAQRSGHTAERYFQFT